MKKRVNEKFIKDKLIPFILREQGRGFAMSTFISVIPPGERVIFDNVRRIVPSCGTMCCIQGAIATIKAGRNLITSIEIKKLIGLTSAEAHGLFCVWKDDDRSYGCSWPPIFMKRFAKAKTPLGKAKATADLLIEVCRTDGKCLHKEHQ